MDKIIIYYQAYLDKYYDYRGNTSEINAAKYVLRKFRKAQSSKNIQKILNHVELYGIITGNLL